MLSGVKQAAGILWSVGGRLRHVYNSSNTEEERRKDRQATVLRAGVFVASCIAFAVIDAHGDAIATLRWVRSLLQSGGNFVEEGHSS